MAVCIPEMQTFARDNDSTKSNKDAILLHAVLCSFPLSHTANGAYASYWLLFHRRKGMLEILVSARACRRPSCESKGGLMTTSRTLG